MWRSHLTHMQNTSLWNIMMVVSQVIFSGITLELHVDQLAVGTPTLTDSTMMMQLLRHTWGVKTLQLSPKWLATPTLSYLAWQHIVKLRLYRITCAADVIQAASKRDLQAYTLSGGNTLRHTPAYGRSRPKHAVSEGSMTLAEDKWRGATLLCDLS